MIRVFLKYFLILLIVPGTLSFFLSGCSDSNQSSSPDNSNSGITSEWRDPLKDKSTNDNGSLLSGVISGQQTPAKPTTSRGLTTTGEDPGEGWGADKNRRAQEIAASDDAGPGYCAKGVANILLRMGYPVTRGNAHDWDTTLPRNGWERVNCHPRDGNCPSGTVLQYESNVHLQAAGVSGKGARDTGGQRWGHVEIVTSGSRKYCSDACRSNWGGTVPENFAGAWVYRGE